MARRGKGKALFLTALVLYAGANGTTLNKTASNNIVVNNKPLTTQTTPVNKEKQERQQPKEIMFLFEEQYLIPELQETPKIKKKKK